MKWVTRSGGVALAIAMVVALGYAWRSSSLAEVLGPEAVAGARGGAEVADHDEAVHDEGDRDEAGETVGRGQGRGMGRGAMGGGGGSGRHDADVSWDAVAGFATTLGPIIALVAAVAMIDLFRKRRSRRARLRLADTGSPIPGT